MENPLQVGEPLSLVTICLDGYGLGQLRNSIASLPMVQLRAEFQHYLAENDDQILLERADIYVIDFDQNREEAVRTAERIHEVLGRTAIFALSSNSEPLLIIRAMQCGCMEYLLKPVDRDELLKALARVREQRREKREHVRGQVLSFLGVKGGSGVTTLATYMGALLAKVHKRSTLLVDYHPELGDASFYLSLQRHRYHFYALVENTHRLDADLLQAFLVPHPSGLDVLQSPDGFDPPYGQVSAEAIGHTLEFLRGRYERILVDCPPGLDKANMAMILQSDQLYLITTPETPALRHLAHHLDQLRSLDYPRERVRVIVNRHSKKGNNSPKKGGVTDDQIERAIDKRIYWKVPNHYAEVMKAINTGAPASFSGSSEFMFSLMRWADVLTAKQPEAAKGKEDVRPAASFGARAGGTAR
jgi:pilus assembly protein CpaE